MSAKKARGKGKGTAETKKPKKAAKKRAPKAKKGKDLVQVRAGIDNKIKNSANLIADKVIEVAKTTGQLASAKYLFEAVGLYPAPASEQSEARPIETGLAHTLLTRMGIPLEPVVGEDDPMPFLTSSAKGTTAKAEEVVEKNEEPEKDQEGEE